MNKTRWTLFTVLIALGLTCALSIFHLRAANPTSGTITLASAPLSWDGTAVGGTHNGEATCVEGVNCDTFTLTVTGTPTEWAGKQIQITMTWVVLAHDYDVYVHKDSNAGPLIDSSTGSAPSTSEVVEIEASDLDADGSTTFTVHAAYFTASPADQYHCVARVINAFAPPPPAPPLSTNWTINYHGECCEGNLSAAGPNTFVLLPVLVQGNKIKKSSNGGQTWTQKYPPAPASVPFGIEGDMQAFGTDVIFFGTELGVAITAHSDDFGETFTPVQNPIASAGNDQAWSYLGPFGGLRPGGALPTDEPYVLAGWMRIGSAAIFSFDGGLTWPIQTPLPGVANSGAEHVICHDNAVDAPALPTAKTTAPAAGAGKLKSVQKQNRGEAVAGVPADTRVANALFARQKAGRYGAWGTDRKFYWSETNEGTLYVCNTADFGVNWSGFKHPVEPGPAADFVVTHSAFDNKGTLYVLHGNKLYVSFDQGQSFAFVHTVPRYGSAERSDPGSDQFFVVDCGTIHIALLQDAPEGRGQVYYLRGSHVDTGTPVWDEELVDEIGFVRLDFIYIVLDGNGVPTISYTTPFGTVDDVTTASRHTALPTGCLTPLSVVSRKTHGTAGPFDIDLPLVGAPGVECRTGGTNNDYTLIFTFPNALAGVTTASVTLGTGTVNNNSGIGPGPNQYTVNLTGVTNAQHLGVTLIGVQDTFGNVGSVTVPMDVLIGDVNAVSGVTGSDVNLAKTQVGVDLSTNNFRMDINTTGFVSGADVNLIKSKVGTALP